VVNLFGVKQIQILNFKYLFFDDRQNDIGGKGTRRRSD
jgi:hypothetical protein